MRDILYWTISLAITALFAVFQRATGPTHPMKGSFFSENGTQVSYVMPRSCTIGAGDCRIVLVPGEGLHGYISWRRHGTQDTLSEISLFADAGKLNGMLPDQPPAGKLDYQVYIKQRKGDIQISGGPVTTRFKSYVPAWILVPHIVFMSLFMLFSVRIFFTALSGEPPVKHAVAANVLFLLAGGFILGPLTQFHAFGQYWTGWPFGTDLTDNKTLAMMFFWLAALWSVFRAKDPRPWLFAAFAVTALVYLVPHSMLGSELDYSTIKTPV